MQFNQEHRVLIMIGIGIVTALVIIGVVLVPTIRSVQQSNQEVYDLRLYLEQKHNRSVNARAAIKQIEQIKDSMVGLEQHIYKRGDELQLITLLEDLSNHHSITQQIKSSNLDNITNNRLTMNLNLTGSYRNIFSYLSDLEKTNYFISMNRFNLTSYSDRTKPGVTELSSLDLEITLYVAN